MLRFFRIYTVPADEHDEGATWLDLFFDLIYVAILIELGNRLSSNLSLQGTVEFALIFIPIWWSWLAIVFHNRYFPADDIGHRLLTVAYMALLILMGFEIHSLTGQTATLFLLTYAALQFILALMYLRAWLNYPEYRSLTSHYAVAYAAAGLMWAVTAFIAPTNFILWGVATAISVLAPAYLRWWRQWRGKPEFSHPTTKYHYMLHRFGELTIIVLGEFFVKLITSSSGRELGAFNIFLGALLLSISVSLWWLYFDHLGHASLTARRSRVGVWIYTHYPLLAAIAAYGVVGNKVYVAIPGEVLADEKRLLLCISLAVAVLALGLIEWSAREIPGERARAPHGIIRAVSAAVLLLLGVFGAGLNVGLLLLLIVAVLVIQVGLDIYWRVNNPLLEAADDLPAGAAV